MGYGLKSDTLSRVLSLGQVHGEEEKLLHALTKYYWYLPPPPVMQAIQTIVQPRQ